MRGIVDGVNAPIPGGESDEKTRMVDLLDIIALNARSEIALGKFDDGCTSLAWDITGSVGPPKRVLAQNWDWRTAVGPNLALGSIKQEGKPDIWMVTEVCQTLFSSACRIDELRSSLVSLAKSASTLLLSVYA